MKKKRLDLSHTVDFRRNFKSLSRPGARQAATGNPSYRPALTSTTGKIKDIFNFPFGKKVYIYIQ